MKKQTKTRLLAVVFLGASMGLGCVQDAAPIKIAPDDAAKLQPDQCIHQVCQWIPPASLLPQAELTIASLSGHYTDSGPTLRAYSPGALSGSDLYLFPDQHYIYVRWADIFPPTIHDKGKWCVKNGFVTLVSDGSLSEKDHPRDCVYLPLTLTENAGSQMPLMGTGEEVCLFPPTSTPAEGAKWPVLLMGTDRDYAYFLENAGSGSLFMLLLCSLEREEAISEADSSALKAKLMKESWHPERL